MQSEKIQTLKFDDEYNTSFPFSINRLVNNTNVPHISVRTPHRHNFHIIVFLKEAKGTGTHSIDFVKHKLKPNVVYLIRAGQVHMFENINVQAVDATTITFPKEFIFPLLPPILEDSENVNEINLSGTDFDYLYDILFRIQIEYDSKSDWNANIIQNYLGIILMHLSRIYLESKKKINPVVDDSMVIKYKHLVNEKYLEFRQVSDYANMLCLTPGHLNDKIKEQTGGTAKDLINERIILEAKRLLFYDEGSIKEIAEKLKFEDVPYFNRFFKTHTSQTPLDFRLKIRKMYK
jgi:AraC family transcriptional regulator, transcriptional activator of pobA